MRIIIEELIRRRADGSVKFSFEPFSNSSNVFITAGITDMKQAIKTLNFVLQAKQIVDPEQNL